ncbi:hypothetical protein GCM10027091_58180 [Streptomyces daliensis]
MPQPPDAARFPRLHGHGSLCAPRKTIKTQDEGESGQESVLRVDDRARVDF